MWARNSRSTQPSNKKNKDGIYQIMNNLEQQIQELKKQFNDKVAAAITNVLSVPAECISVTAENTTYDISINLQGASFYHFQYNAETDDINGFAAVVEFNKDRLPAIVPIPVSIKVLEAIRGAVVSVIGDTAENNTAESNTTESNNDNE